MISSNQFTNQTYDDGLPTYEYVDKYARHVKEIDDVYSDDDPMKKEMFRDILDTYDAEDTPYQTDSSGNIPGVPNLDRLVKVRRFLELNT